MRLSILFAFAVSVAAQVSSSAYREDGACPQSVMLGGDRMEFRCVTIPMMIGFVYGISPDRITGPAWITGPRYDAAARSPEGLESMVRDSFHLRFHRESVTRSVLALIPADGGMRLPTTPRSPITIIGALPASAAFYGPTIERAGIITGHDIGTVRHASPGVYDASSITTRGLADLLDYIAPLSTPIIDMTGSTSSFPLHLEVTLPELPAGPDAFLWAFNDALAKLGLKLERRRALIETLIIDHIDRP